MDHFDNTRALYKNVVKPVTHPTRRPWVEVLLGYVHRKTVLDLGCVEHDQIGGKQKSLDGRTSKALPLRSYVPELLGLVALSILLVYVLHSSWRKWPDPIVDSGPQWYAAWRISNGGMLFREMLWVYGPLSAYFNGLVFKMFGSSLTVLFTANLIIYAAILCLSYLAFRKAWGWFAAFAACGIFISIFSFSHLTGVGNYTYVAPYSHETTHGMLLMLLIAFVATRWSKGKSTWYAFLLGLMGGLAAVLKPEFMVGGAVLGVAALLLRYAQHQSVQRREYLLLFAGIISPTLLFTVIFASSEPFTSALAHASNAWWLLLAYNRPGGIQSTYLNGLVACSMGFAEWQRLLTGFDHPWRNAVLEIQFGAKAALVMAGFGVAGWIANRGRRAVGVLIFILIASGMVILAPWRDGWAWAGRCLPLLLFAVLTLACFRLIRRIRGGEPEAELVMQLMLALLATSLLTRMALFPRVYHYGFFQAALATMVVAAVLVREVPSWAGPGRAGQLISGAGGVLALLLLSASVIVRSNFHRADQTQTVGLGPDQFIVFNSSVDPIGALVDWTSRWMSSVPPQAKLLVLPEGLGINFLSKHVSPVVLDGAGASEQSMVESLSKAPPDYIALITRNENSQAQYGATGNPGFYLMQWVEQNYEAEAAWGDPFSGKTWKGARILRLHHTVPASAAP